MKDCSSEPHAGRRATCYRTFEVSSSRTRSRSRRSNFDRDPRVTYERAARRAGLLYVHHEQTPGISRRRFGRGFGYYLAGRKIRDGRLVERCNALAIPPAYRDVWICPEERGHLQAVGVDDRGRRQYRYHELWAEARKQAKFDRLPEFAAGLPKLRRTIARHLRLDGLPRDKVLAACVKLIDQTCIRVGNAEYAKTNGSFGLTTLQDDHATIGRGRVRFEFTAKGGLERELEIRDSRLAELIRQTRDLPGQELLQYLNEAGNVVDIGSGDVNAYLQAHVGPGFTAKTFRTWHATVMAFGELHGLDPEPGKTKRNRQILAAIDAVAESLGNTRAVARNSYIHPAVFDAFEKNVLPASYTAAPTLRGLNKTEAAVLHLLG